MSGLTLAVDPGLTGAWALLDSEGCWLVADLPIIRDRSLAWVDGAAWQSMLLQAIDGRRPCHAVVERVGAMPRQGVASSFGFGVSFGSILATLQTLQLPLELVTPATWKRALGLSSDKRASLDKARLLFPSAELHLAKHDGRAEALLIAHWALNRRPAA